MDKLRACIIGATGAAGQNVVEALENHPWFEVSGLAASPRSAGKSYRDAIEGALFFEEMPNEGILEMEVSNVKDIEENLSQFDLLFSALPSGVAKEVEPKLAKYKPVISTASAFRYEDDVPILVPEVNPEHTKLIDRQMKERRWKGYIVPEPNCTTTGLVITLKPIDDAFGINDIHMVSMQSLSGAGEEGIRKDSKYRKSVEMNVLPYIEEEEEKVVKETKKILGKYSNGRIVNVDIKIDCSCNRVHVERVHTEVVYLDTKERCSIEEVKEAMINFVGEPQKLKLPSAPERPIIALEDLNMPQPKLHKNYGGM